MKNLEEETIKLLLNEANEILFEMANIHPEETGIKAMLYSTFNGKSKFKHGPRVKIETKNYGLISILLPDLSLDKKYNLKTMQNEDRKIINQAIKYLKGKENIFLAHWNGQIRDDQLHDILKNRITLEDIIKKKGK